MLPISSKNSCPEPGHIGTFRLSADSNSTVFAVRCQALHLFLNILFYFASNTGDWGEDGRQSAKNSLEHCR
jgi:hypothetical protein